MRRLSFEVCTGRVSKRF